MSSTASPVRYPDLKSQDVMTRRAWVLVVTGILIPGSAQLLAGNRRVGRFAVGTTFLLWALVVIAVLVYFFARATFVTIATNYFALWAAQAAIVFYGVLWIVLMFDVIRLVRLVRVAPSARAFVAGLAVLSLVLVGGAGAYGLMIAGTTRATVDSVFSGGTIADPINGRYNILLLGGDAGPDRNGMRPDSISVVSVEAATGKATIIGIPRNLENVPFVAGSPMAAEYPNGYGTDNGCQVDVCLINSIYTEVQLVTPEMYPDAVAQGSQPGIQAMKDAVEGVLGITIQYYVLIDMQGFSDLIDALGGVTIDSVGRYPIAEPEALDENGNPPAGTPFIEAGVQHMDGFTALWYARIRAGSNDYDRMQRQHQVQEAILQQFDPSNLLSKFEAVAKAGAQVVSTDIPQPMLGYFVDLAGKSRVLPVDKLEIVPPLIDVQYPDIAYIHQVVADQLTIATPAPNN
jgi:LCP family protein required for cell wall assembly